MRPTSPSRATRSRGLGVQPTLAREFNALRTPSLSAADGVQTIFKRGKETRAKNPATVRHTSRSQATPSRALRSQHSHNNNSLRTPPRPAYLSAADDVKTLL